MNDNLLGGVFEMFMRYCLLLDASDGNNMNEYRICALDYITTYANDFGFDNYNLNGNGDYRRGNSAYVS